MHFSYANIDTVINWQAYNNHVPISNPLACAIEMIKRNANPNSSLQMALMNLESLECTEKFEKNRVSTMEESLNFYIQQNDNLQSKVKTTQQSYDSLKQENKANKISSQEKIRMLRSLFWEQVEDLK